MFQRATWLRAVRDDPRLDEVHKDLAIQHGIAADGEGVCDQTKAQLKRCLLIRASDGGYVPDRTLDRRRARLVRLGYLNLISKGKGEGHGSRYACVLPLQERATERATLVPQNAPPSGAHSISPLDKTYSTTTPPPFGYSNGSSGRGVEDHSSRPSSEREKSPVPPQEDLPIVNIPIEQTLEEWQAEIRHWEQVAARQAAGQR